MVLVFIPWRVSTSLPTLAIFVQSNSVGARVVESGWEGLYGRPRPVPCAHLWGNAITPSPPGHHTITTHPVGLTPKKQKCQGTESNRRHQHFQCCALPTELPWHEFVRATL